MARRLQRNTRNAILGGVASGFADYIDLDPVIIRLIFLVLCLAGGSGVIVYLVCWLIMPRDDEGVAGVGAAAQAPPADRFAEEVREAGERVVDNIRQSRSEGAGRGRLIGGLVLIVLGFLFLADEVLAVDWLSFRYLWPLLLVGGGVALFVQGMKSRDQ